MLNSDASVPVPPPDGLPLLAAADLQDHLMVASNDLERLQRLLDDASETLSGHFYGATHQLKHLLREAAEHIPPELAGDGGAMHGHTQRRLRGCADRIARDAMGDDDEDGPAVVEEVPIRPNPVTQDEMDAGSIDLF